MTGAQQHGDALALLRSLPDGISAAAFFDPQHRSTLERLQYGNEGARQKLRCALPAMSDSYIEQCCRDIARVLRPTDTCSCGPTPFASVAAITCTLPMSCPAST